MGCWTRAYPTDPNTNLKSFGDSELIFEVELIHRQAIRLLTIEKGKKILHVQRAVNANIDALVGSRHLLASPKGKTLKY